MISRTKFGVVLQQVDSASFSGQTLCVLLGNSFSFQGIQRANIALEANSEATASITLPGMLLSGTDLNHNARIVYFVYLSDGLFLMRTSYAERPYTRVGSILLGANVGNTSSQSDLDQPVQLKFLKNPSVEDGNNTQCSHWNQSLDEGYGGWSTESCSLVEATREEATCECDRLESFTILVVSYCKDFYLLPHNYTVSPTLGCAFV